PVVNGHADALLPRRQQRLQPAVHRREPTSGRCPRATILHSVESAPRYLFDEEPAAPAFVAGDPAIKLRRSKVHPGEHLLIHFDFTSRIQFRVGYVSFGPHVVREVLEDEAKLLPVVEYQVQLLERGSVHMSLMYV